MVGATVTRLKKKNKPGKLIDTVTFQQCLCFIFLHGTNHRARTMPHSIVENVIMFENMNWLIVTNYCLRRVLSMFARISYAVFVCVRLRLLWHIFDYCTWIHPMHTICLVYCVDAINNEWKTNKRLAWKIHFQTYALHCIKEFSDFSLSLSLPHLPPFSYNCKYLPNCLISAIFVEAHWNATATFSLVSIYLDETREKKDHQIWFCTHFCFMLMTFVRYCVQLLYNVYIYGSDRVFDGKNVHQKWYNTLFVAKILKMLLLWTISMFIATGSITCGFKLACNTNCPIENRK